MPVSAALACIQVLCCTLPMPALAHATPSDALHFVPGSHRIIEARAMERAGSGVDANCSITSTALRMDSRVALTSATPRGAKDSSSQGRAGNCVNGVDSA